MPPHAGEKGASLIPLGGFNAIRNRIIKESARRTAVAVRSSAVGYNVTVFLDAYHDSLRQLCLAYGVRRLEAFGSGIRADFDPNRSDVDFLVDFGDQPAAGSFKRYMNLEFDLESLLGRSVDLVETAAVTNRFSFAPSRRVARRSMRLELAKLLEDIRVASADAPEMAADQMFAC